ncbi:helix-turn-helix domain-containing protein [Tianweitania sediminis]|uniref:helix-turn-helix domain-containing protein n=1 Tax=Tianweitania sediminis TaxID=1502156 RepID=UPI003622189D
MIATLLGVSTRQLQRKFERHLNLPPKHSMMELRLQRARNLILQSEHGGDPVSPDSRRLGLGTERRNSRGERNLRPECG